MRAIHKLHHDYGRPCGPFYMNLLRLFHMPCEHTECQGGQQPAAKMMFGEGMCIECRLAAVKGIRTELQEHTKRETPVRMVPQPYHHIDSSILESMVARAKRPEFIN